MRTEALVIAIVLAAAVMACPAWGQTEGAPAGEGGYLPEPAAPSASVAVIDVLGKLLMAVLAAWGAVRAIRWWQDGRPGPSGERGRGGRRLWLEETLSLGSDGRLYLVEVEGRRMLLAAREGSVAQVAEFGDEPVRPAAFRSVRTRTDGSTDELNVVQAGVSTRAVRPDVVESTESWEQRRGRLLRELQEQG